MWINPGSARDLVRARDQERQREGRSQRIRRNEGGQSRRHPGN
jgi:hypothetical protein